MGRLMQCLACGSARVTRADRDHQHFKKTTLKTSHAKNQPIHWRPDRSKCVRLVVGREGKGRDPGDLALHHRCIPSFVESRVIIGRIFCMFLIVYG